MGSSQDRLFTPEKMTQYWSKSSTKSTTTLPSIGEGAYIHSFASSYKKYSKKKKSVMGIIINNNSFRSIV